MRTHPLTTLFLMAAAAANAQTVPELAAAAGQLTKGLGAAGAGLAVVRGDVVVHRSLHGAFADDQVMPVGAASEWLTVVTVLAVADADLIDVDVPISRYLPELNRTDK